MTRRPGRRASQSRHRVLQDGHAGRSRARVPPRRPSCAASDANAHFFIGLVALKQARWREAMEALRLAAEKGGSRPAVLHNLGFAYEQLGRLEDAEAALRRGGVPRARQTRACSWAGASSR